MRFPAAFRAAGAALLAAGLALLAGVCFAVAPAASAEPDAPYMAEVLVVRAQQACFAATVRVTGFLVAREEAVVTLDAPGLRVTEVLVGEGDKVTEGQELVRLTRQDGNTKPGAAPQTITLKAPVNGVVMRSSALVGAMASAMPGEPLFRIAVDGEIELEAEVPSVHVPVLAAGQIARVEIESGQELSGSIRLVPAAIDQRTQLGRARLSLGKHPALRFGMFARATIDANRSCGLSVPRSAVQYRTEGASVQMVRDNVIETRRVQLGFHSDYDMEIRGGLSEGNLVVANAGSSLRDGDKVKPVLADATRPPRP
ncbi:MAG: efflux RND transporter periplasmic adaptor subunit [Xanthobacteraceae bacterium]